MLHNLKAHNWQQPHLSQLTIRENTWFVSKLPRKITPVEQGSQEASKAGCFKGSGIALVIVRPFAIENSPAISLAWI
jgi:hypothetical protein